MFRNFNKVIKILKCFLPIVKKTAEVKLSNHAKLLAYWMMWLSASTCHAHIVSLYPNSILPPIIRFQPKKKLKYSFLLSGRSSGKSKHCNEFSCWCFKGEKNEKSSLNCCARKVAEPFNSFRSGKSFAKDAIKIVLKSNLPLVRHPYLATCWLYFCLLKLFSSKYLWVQSKKQLINYCWFPFFEKLVN